MLRAELRRRLLAARGIYVTEACDRCGQLLGELRYTRRGESGEWCSRECRDGVKQAVEHATLVQRKYATHAERVAARREKKAAHMRRARHQKTASQPTMNQQDTVSTFRSQAVHPRQIIHGSKFGRSQQEVSNTFGS